MAATVIFLTSDTSVPVARNLAPVFLNVPPAVAGGDALTDTLGVPLTDVGGTQLTDVFLVSTRTRNIQIQAQIASVTYADATSFHFIGGRGPYLPPLRVVPPPVVAFVPRGTRVTPPWTGWWIEADQPPQLRVKLAQGPPPAVDAPPRSTTALDQLFATIAWLTPTIVPLPGLGVPGQAPFVVPSSVPVDAAIVVSWVPLDPAPTLPRYLPASITAVRVDNPPIVKRDPDQDAVIAGWLLVDPPSQPRVRLLQQPAAVAPFVFALDTARQDVLDAWITDQPQATAREQLPPSLLAVRVDAPPPRRQAPDTSLWAVVDQVPQSPSRLVPIAPFIVSADTARQDVLDAWILEDPALQSVRKLPQPAAAPAQFVASIDYARQDVLVGWIPADPAPVVAKKLCPVFEAVRVDNPPLSGPPADLPTQVSIVADWALPDTAPPILAVLDVIVEFPLWFLAGDLPAATETSASILSAWVPSDAPILSSRFVPKIAQAPAPFVPSADTARQDVLDAWIPPDPAPIVARGLNPAFEAVRVDNPGVKRDQDQDAIFASWLSPDAQTFPPRYVPRAVPVQFIPGGAVSATDAVVAMAWADAAPTLEYQAPLSVPASVDNPPRRSQGTSLAVLAAWVVADAPLASPPRSVPSAGVMPRPSAPLAAILGAWAPEVPAGVTQRQTTIQSVDVPPRRYRSAQIDVVGLWPTVADPLPTLHSQPVTLGARVDNPPTVSAAVSGNFSVVLMAWTPSMFEPWSTAIHTGQGMPPPFVPPPGSAIFEQLASPFELGSTLRAGLGSLSDG